MQTNLPLSFKQRVIILGLGLALSAVGALGMRAFSHPVRVASQPVSVAVNWNGFAANVIILPPTNG